MSDNPKMIGAVEALLIPTKALGELLLALIGHLHDRNQIDPNAIIALLEKRIASMTEGDEERAIAAIMLTQIDWLRRVGTGQPGTPPRLN
jgi:hypothetical protein